MKYRILIVPADRPMHTFPGFRCFSNIAQKEPEANRNLRFYENPSAYSLTAIKIPAEITTAPITNPVVICSWSSSTPITAEVRGCKG